MAAPLDSPPLRKNDPEHVRNMMEKYKIRFFGPADAIRPKPWPANLEKTIEQVRKLGHTDYDTYTENVRADDAQQPWRHQRLARAERLFGTARRCLDAGKIEAGWRHAIEPLVCGRFFVEVACKTCRGRLWRSEEEVAPDSAIQRDASDEDGLASLQDRQDRRKPCRCPSTGFRSEMEDQRLNPIFDDRAEHAIEYTQEMQEDLGRREHRPDRIFGLFQSRTIKSLLRKPDQRHPPGSKTVRQAVRTTPLHKDGQPIVFPFLVMEAKSEKSACSFRDIDMQTAFAIRELVLLQEGLESAASGVGHPVWDAAPLVWYFSYKGEQWRLHAAFPSQHGGAGAVDVVRLWSGDIDSARGALQVLLLVDYICDWARDKFRESTIRSLAALSRSDRQGTVASDIFSLRAPTATPAPTMRPRIVDETGPTATPTFTTRPGAVDETTATPRKVPQAGTGEKKDFIPGRSLDPDELERMVGLPSPQSPVRDIRFIKSRSRGVLITWENIDALRELSSSDELFSELVKRFLLIFVLRGVETTGDVLNQLQATWHRGGNALDPVGLGPLGPSNKKYIVTMSLGWYVSASWEPVRELYWVAIENSALLYLSRAWPVRPLFSPENIPEPRTETLTTGKLEKAFRPYTKACARLSITACLLGSYATLDPGKPSFRSWYGTRFDLEDVPLSAVVTQLHSDYEYERLGSCPTLVHDGSYEHIVNRIDPEDARWEKWDFTELWAETTGRQEMYSVLDVETPVLVMDPQELDQDTKLPAHCTFTVGEGPPKPFLDHPTGSHKTYFVAERVMGHIGAPWIFTTAPTITRQLINTPNSGNVLLVQASTRPAEETSTNREERVEDTPEEPAIDNTPAPMSEPITSVERSEAVTDWAQRIKHEVIDIE